MKRFLFDVTDIIEFSKKNHFVTGIQRVQIQLLSSLAKQYDPLQIRCIYHDRKNAQPFEFSASDLFKSSTITPKDIIGKLGFDDASAFLNKASVKQALNRYNHRKIYRSLKKIELYLIAAFFPNRLSTLGYFHSSSEKEERIPRTELKTISNLDSLVMLGPNWNNPQVFEFSRKISKQGGKTIQVIHDLIPLMAPEFFPAKTRANFKTYFDQCVTHVDHFICVSQSTQRDLTAKIDARTVNASVVLLAHEFVGAKRDQLYELHEHVSLNFLKTTSYVLCVGTIEPRKNIIQLLKAWQNLHIALGTEIPKLVLVGKFGWMNTEFMNQLNMMGPVKEKVVVLESPSDAELSALYSNCLFTVYPSFYEGWGLPVGESAWFGKACLASDASSIPEVCGNLLEYFDPHDLDILTAQLMKYVTSPEHVEAMASTIKKTPLRTWDDVASDLYKKIN